jgi:hypothetical protein
MTVEEAMPQAGPEQDLLFSGHDCISELPAGNRLVMFKIGVRINCWIFSLNLLIRLLLNIRMKMIFLKGVAHGIERCLLPLFQQICQLCLVLKNPGRETYRPEFKDYLTAGIVPYSISLSTASLTASRDHRINFTGFSFALYGACQIFR